MRERCEFVDYLGVRCSLDADHEDDWDAPKRATAKQVKDAEAQDACEREARACAEAELDRREKLPVRS